MPVHECGVSVLWVWGKCAVGVGRVCCGCRGGCGVSVLWVWGKCAVGVG